MEKNTADVLMHAIDRQWAQAKQAEDQRATMTNLIIIVAIGLEGLIVQRGFDRASQVLSVVLLLLGVYGAIASAKFYERFRLSMHRASKFVGRLDEIEKEALIGELDKSAEDEHKLKHSLLVRFRLHHIWLILHLSISLFGLINIIVSIFK